LDLYRKYFSERDFERIELFLLINRSFEISRVLYPGSYVHISPSFIFQNVVYVDSDKKAIKFFKTDLPIKLVEEKKAYKENPVIRFHPMDYFQDIPEKKESFDLLISQYAGFVSQACKNYLRTGGILLANNSHGDASMASLDGDFDPAGVITGSPQQPKLIVENLEDFFTPKREVDLTREMIEKRKRGIAYKKRAQNFVFRRVS